MEQGMSEGYEFTDEENKVFHQLSSSMKFVGGVLVVLGVIGLFEVLQGDYGEVFDGVVQLVVGILTIIASKPIQKIVDTEGDDITHLMNAMKVLLKLYNIKKYVYISVMVVIGLILMSGSAS